MPTEKYDAIVIGSGQGGKPLSIALAKSGRKTAIIERKDIGGTCVNVGCTPTKTMVASGRVAYLARRAADYGVHVGPVSVDMGEVRTRKQAIVEEFRNGGLRAIERTNGLDLLRGEASFTGPHSLAVRMNDGGTRELQSDLILINTGARASTPPVAGLESTPRLDSTSIMELDELPAHLVVLGGGYIGVEFGQMFRRFGSQVTIAQRGERLLAREDPDVADEVAAILRQDGITVLLNTEARKTAQTADGIEVTVTEAGVERTVKASHLLVAAGRIPNTESLNLQAAGVHSNRHGFVTVNEKLETNVSGVYALGDVNGGPQFTHISYDDFRIIRANIIEGGNTTTAGRLVPSTIFIDPQLGRVGLSETEARASGRKIRVAKIPMSYVARAIEMSETRGFIKAVVDAETNQILGCAVLGVEGGEVMAMIQIAMMGRLPYTVLKDAIFAHPTLAEALNTLFMSLDG